MECILQINNHSYTLTEFVKKNLDTDQHWAIPAQSFLKAWLSDQLVFPIQTSGSTGNPKTIYLTRAQMIASAETTIKTLKIPNGTHALLCINTVYIGGQMMLVRAIVGSWNIELVAPTMDPSIEVQGDRYGFAAMVPLQIRALLGNTKDEFFLNNISKVIIGGAPISDDLILKLQDVKSQCYHTYGMTETVSHIGLKTLNGANKSEWFDVIQGNEIDLDHRGCLKVKGLVTKNKWITTNDLVEINGTQFKWLGRADLVANSGGIKILLENIEASLNALLPQHLQSMLLVWKAPDKGLGERLIGMTTNQNLIDHFGVNADKLKNELPPYHFPKDWLLTSQFSFTESGKLDRLNTYKRHLAQKTT